jgi:hypothetical protein
VDDDTSQSGPLDELDALMGAPERWREIPVETLHQLVYYQCLSYGIDPDDDAVPGLTALCRVAVERMHPGARLQVVQHLARAIERVHREQDVREGAGCTNALLPFLVSEPDPSVVATAAFEMATLLPLEDDDPLTGPRYVRSLLEEVREEDPRAGLIGGLLQVGDRRVAPLVEGAWRELGFEGRQTLALLILGFRALHGLTVDFLVSWLEDEARDPSAPGFGIVAATLARAGHHASEHGVVEAARIFPATAAKPGEAYATSLAVRRETMAARIRKRLHAAARREQPPELMRQVLEEWGLDQG